MQAGLAFEKCFFDESDAESSVGGGFWMVISSTFIGGKRAKGACPCASSRMVMPKDQMSASELYLHRTSSLHRSCTVRASARPRLPGAHAAAVAHTLCTAPSTTLYIATQPAHAFCPMAVGPSAYLRSAPAPPYAGHIQANHQSLLRPPPAMAMYQGSCSGGFPMLLSRSRRLIRCSS